MGFKCPLCLKDFGRDKKKWGKHIKDKHKGCAKDIVNGITNAYEKQLKEIMNKKNKGVNHVDEISC